MAFSNRFGPIVLGVVVMIPLGLSACRSDDGTQATFFRFSVEGEEFSVDDPTLTVSAIPEDNRQLFSIHTPAGTGEPRASAVWRMTFDSNSDLEGLEVTDRDFRADPSATFVLRTQGESGVSLGPESTLTFKFEKATDDTVEGSFSGSNLPYSESFTSMTSRPVTVSGRFKISVRKNR